MGFKCSIYDVEINEEIKHFESKNWFHNFKRRAIYVYIFIKTTEN